MPMLDLLKVIPNSQSWIKEELIRLKFYLLNYCLLMDLWGGEALDVHPLRIDPHLWSLKKTVENLSGLGYKTKQKVTIMGKGPIGKADKKHDI